MDKNKMSIFQNQIPTMEKRAYKRDSDWNALFSMFDSKKVTPYFF
jgi:hypothetical protein